MNLDPRKRVYEVTTTPKKISEDFIIVVVILGLVLNIVATAAQPYAIFVIPLLLFILIVRVHVLSKQAIFVKRRVKVSSSDWGQYWLDRAEALSRVSAFSIQTTGEMRTKMKTLIRTLGKVGLEDCEIALIVGAVWTNGIAIPEELAKLGSLWQEKLYAQYDIDAAYKALTGAEILLPAQTFPKTDKTVCLISNLDTIEDSIESLLKTRHDWNFGVEERTILTMSARKLLRDFAINKSKYMLWPFSPDGNVRMVQTRYPYEDIEYLTPETYTDKVLDVVKRAGSRLLISLEYGTGITKRPLKEIAEKLREGTVLEICITPQPISKSVKRKSEAESEWEKTNGILRSLRNHGSVTVYKVPEPFHTWHMWLSMQNNDPIEGIGFFRNGCLPFWHQTYYAHSKKSPKTLRDLYGHWKEMVQNGHWFEKRIR